MDTTERREQSHDRWQDAMLWAGTLGVIGLTLQAGQVIADDSPWAWVELALRGLGWIAFVAIWFWLLRLTNSRSELLTSAVEDERVRHLRAEAMRFALTVVLVLQFAVLLLEPLLTIRQGDSAGLTIAVSMVAALWHFRRGSRR